MTQIQFENLQAGQIVVFNYSLEHILWLKITENFHCCDYSIDYDCIVLCSSSNDFMVGQLFRACYYYHDRYEALNDP